MKVLFAFARAGSSGVAECQAVESGTAAWPCVEKAEMKDSLVSNTSFDLPLFLFFPVEEHLTTSNSLLFEMLRQ